MNLRELLKYIREEKGYSFQEIGDILGYRKSYISDIEKGKSVSYNVLESYLKAFPLYEEKLIEAYTKEKLPDSFLKKESLDRAEKIKNFKLKAYDYDSINDGRVDLNKYSEVEYMLFFLDLVSIMVYNSNINKKF